MVTVVVEMCLLPVAQRAPSAQDILPSNLLKFQEQDVKELHPTTVAAPRTNPIPTEHGKSCLIPVVVPPMDVGTILTHSGILKELVSRVKSLMGTYSILTWINVAVLCVTTTFLSRVVIVVRIDARVACMVITPTDVSLMSILASAPVQMVERQQVEKKQSMMETHARHVL